MGWACYTHFSCDCPCPTLVDPESKPQDAALSPEKYFDKQMWVHFNHMKRKNLLAGNPAFPEVRRYGTNPKDFVDRQVLIMVNDYNTQKLSKEEFWAARGPH